MRVLLHYFIILKIYEKQNQSPLSINILKCLWEKKKKKKVMNWKRNFILRKWTEIDRMDQVDSCRP